MFGFFFSVGEGVSLFFKVIVVDFFFLKIFREVGNGGGFGEERVVVRDFGLGIF